MSKQIPNMKSLSLSNTKIDRDEREFQDIPGGNRWTDIPGDQEDNVEDSEDERGSLFDQHESDYDIDPDDPPLVHRGKRSRRA